MLVEILWGSGDRTNAGNGLSMLYRYPHYFSRHRNGNLHQGIPKGEHSSELWKYCQSSERGCHYDFEKGLYELHDVKTKEVNRVRRATRYIQKLDGRDISILYRSKVIDMKLALMGWPNLFWSIR